MTIPRKIRSAVGLAEGDLVKVKAVGKKIVITPQLVIDRSKFPAADEEYTPAQRRVIDRRLAEAEKGPYYGPFKNGTEISAFLKRRGAKAGKPKTDR